MKKSIIFFSLIGLTFAETNSSYSWEDGGTILGSYGNVSNPQNVGITGSVSPYEGSAMLSVSESPLDGTPQAYVSFIENLTEGDVVTASFWGWDETPGSSPSLRIWGGYASNGDINDYQGSAGGNNDYTDGTGWSELSNTWTIASGKEALVVQARLYSGDNDPTEYFIDLITVTAPNSATITFPVPPSLVADAGSDQTVAVNSVVTLDGSGSEGNIDMWAWTQLTGLSVVINNNDQPMATFTAPASEADLTLELAVIDDGGATDRDTVNISVVDIGVSTVFISEYVEGSSNNKYLEIYNGDITAVDLETEGYTLARDDNGNMDFTYSVLSDWGSLNNLASGAVIVLAADGHEIYSSPDSVLLYNSPLHFNGNDAVALLKNGVVVDIVGELGNSNNHIKDMTLTRNANISQGRPTFTWSEWTELSTDNVSGLGDHNANENAPSVVISSISPDFITSNTEIEVTATIIPVDGTISSAIIFFGTDGNLLNEAEMWPDIGDIWMATVPSQDGNSLLELQVIATDIDGNVGESAVSSFLVASDTPTEISDIHDDIDNYLAEIVTIQGMVTIGSGILDDDNTRAYIQDESGRGLNLFDFDLIEGINRGDELHLVGYVDQYITTVEVTNFVFHTLSTGNNLPAAIVTTPTGANSSNYEGTLISFEGAVSETESVSNGAGTQLTIDDVTYVQIWNTTGINTAQYIVGSEWSFTGVGSQYSYAEIYQLLVGYEEDIESMSIGENQSVPTEFSLSPAFPNPFNPSTSLKWMLNESGDYELSAYNLLGQKVVTIASGYGELGSFSTIWETKNLPSGVYFVVLKSENRRAIQKVMLLR
mgnify:CR=1 FL=1|jgi:hypothetical protein|tara:strand:+ start:2016 stop:4493 length:2478 start_codon:yes stop_codon:yes gene_type:complete